MYKRLSMRNDLHLTALQILEAVTQQYIKKPAHKKHPVAVALGRLDGKRVGNTRAAKRSPKPIAHHTAHARLAKKR